MTGHWLLGSLWALVPVLLLVPGHLEAQANGTLVRHVDVEPFGTLELGRPFVVGREQARLVDENLYLLPAGADDAEGLLVALFDGDGTVSSIIFFHPPGRGYADVVAGYARDFGPPEYRAHGSCGAWEDAETAIEVVRVPTTKADFVLSAMFDLATSEASPASSCRLLPLAQVIVQGR